MKLVNRAVAVLRARQPYVDWANRFVRGGLPLSVSDFADAGSAFLIPAFDRDEEIQAFIDRHAPAMFEHELGMWADDPATWPPTRDAATFRAWFHVEVHDVVMDLGPDDLTAAEAS